MDVLVLPRMQSCSVGWSDKTQIWGGRRRFGGLKSSQAFKWQWQCQKMFVPGFGEMSPEAKAATKLHDFFTYLAVKIVLAQLESYNKEAYKDLMDFVNRTSLKYGDDFCARLMRESPKHKGLESYRECHSMNHIDPHADYFQRDSIAFDQEFEAMRILEVRSAYARRDFEWDNLKRLAIKIVDESNTNVMREYLKETSYME